MNALLQAAAELQQFLTAQKLPFCFIGGLAVLRWGLPRITQDVDASVFVRLGQEEAVIASILARFAPRISDAHAFALDSRVVLVSSSQGVPLDVVFAQFDFEKQIIDRATPFAFAENVTLRTVSADDLVVLKAFAGRDQDWLDVRGIVSTQKLNRPWILEQLALLCQVQPENDALSRLEQLFRKSDSP